MMKILNVLAVIALIGSATAAYSVKYETILMAEKLKKREAERGREQHAIAILKAEWHLLNRPQRLTKIAPPEAGMQLMTARQIARARDVPHVVPEDDMIAKTLEGTLTGSLPTPDSTRKSTGKTPEIPVNKVSSAALISSQPKKAGASDRAGASSTGPMALTSHPLNTTTSRTPPSRPNVQASAPLALDGARPTDTPRPPKSLPLPPKAQTPFPVR